MKKVFFIEKSLIMQIHQQQIQRFGGANGFLDEFNFEASLATPIHTWYRTQDIYETAADYFYSIASKRSFLNGNKRTATACMLIFLIKNGVKITISNLTLYQAVTSVLETPVPRTKLANILRQNSTKLHDVTSEELFSNEWLSWNSVGIVSISSRSIKYKTVAKIRIKDVVFCLEETKDENYDSLFRFGRNIIYTDDYSSFPTYKPEAKFALIARFQLGNVSKTFEVSDLEVSAGKIRFLILEKLSEYLNWRYKDEAVNNFDLEYIPKHCVFYYWNMEPSIQFEHKTYDVV